MTDATESDRRQRLEEFNAEPDSREALEAQHGQVWSTVELSHDFHVIGFIVSQCSLRSISSSLRCADPKTAH